MSRFRVRGWSLGLPDYGLAFRVKGLGFRVSKLGFRVPEFGFQGVRVLGFVARI